MANRLAAFFSGEISIDPDAKHYALYKFWREHSRGNRPGYRENFCHYMRVLLFWAPLIWFFKVPLSGFPRFKWVRPWMIILPSLIVFVTVIAAILNPGGTWLFWRIFLIALGKLLICGGAFGLLVYVAYRLDKSGYLVDIIMWALCPIWGPFYLTYRVFRWLTRRFGGFKVFCTTLSILLVSIFAPIGILKGWGVMIHIFLISLLWTAVILALLALLIVALIWVDQAGKAEVQRSRVAAIERSRSRHSVPVMAPKKRRTSVWRQVGQFFKLIGQFIMARKRKICPFIILPE